jgi:undecaprenyl diphosphate synthase
LRKEVDELHKNGVRLQFIGDRQVLSTALQTQMQQAEALTYKNKSLIVNVIVNYGGKWDLVQAAKAIAKKVASNELSIDAIDESLFSQELSTRGLPDPDLFIRTSGEQRISNFFLWQLAYTELYFTDVLWPDFSAVEFEKALASFAQRERRYGKTSKQLNEVNDA